MGLSIYIYFLFELTTRGGKTDESAAEEVVYDQDEVKPAHPAQIEIVCRNSMFSHGTRVKVTVHVFSCYQNRKTTLFLF